MITTIQQVFSGLSQELKDKHKRVLHSDLRLIRVRNYQQVPLCFWTCNNKFITAPLGDVDEYKELTSDLLTSYPEDPIIQMMMFKPNHNQIIDILAKPIINDRQMPKDQKHEEMRKLILGSTRGLPVEAFEVIQELKPKEIQKPRKVIIKKPARAKRRRTNLLQTKTTRMVTRRMANAMKQEGYGLRSLEERKTFKSIL